VSDSLDNRRPVTPEVADFWARACAATGMDPASAYQVWHFGAGEPMATELALLVRDGPKRATTALKAGVDLFPETGAVEGGLSVVTTYAGEPVVLIRTTRVDVVPFEEVDAAFAWEEGEGDRSLADWRAGHWAFFEAECAEMGIPRSPRMEVVCERFEKLWP